MAGSNDKFFYPVSKETLHQYAESIFAPIRRGECVTTVWVPMAGRRMWNKFIIENVHLFENELPYFNKYVLVYVEPLDLTEESLAGYLRLMGKSFMEAGKKNAELSELISNESAEIFYDDSSTYAKLFENLKNTLSKVASRGFEVIFFLGEFDELSFANSVLFNNLQSLWSRMHPAIHYVFLTAEDLSSSVNASKFRELNSAILQNVIYIPIRKEKEVDYLIDFFSFRLGTKFSVEEKDLIKRLCGGHPYLIKVVTRLIRNVNQGTGLKDLENDLKGHFETISVVRRIYALRTENEKDVLRKVAKGEDVPQSRALKRLLSLGLIEKGDKSGYRLFGELFKIVADKLAGEGTGLSYTGGSKLYLDKDEGAVSYAGDSIEDKFSNQEYKVIKYFLSDPRKLRTREEIGEVLWGEESYEKYSDWAIDQLVSKLRKKLKKMGTSSSLTTLRGRGYKLTSI